ncbi:MAG: BrnT family toxin [Thiotrichaceae bacterium]|nr:BrnT family toxin [Thiotrichaceae bacterium]
MFHSFIWDEQKNKTNIKKHSVGLKAGISVFEDHLRIERYDQDNSTQDEDRYITIGRDHRTQGSICHLYNARCRAKDTFNIGSSGRTL